MNEINSKQDQQINLQIVEGAECISDFGEHWDDLFARATDATPFLSRPWVSTFIREGRARGKPLFMLVWHGTKLVALFPLAIRNCLIAKIAEPIGTGEPSYLGLLLDPKYPAVVEYIAEAIKTKKIASLVCIQDLLSEDKSTNALLHELKKRGFLCLSVYRNPCYCIKLDGSYDEYLKKTKSPRRQRELKRNEKKLYELGKIEIQRYTGSEITSDIVSRMAAIQNESWMNKRGAAVLYGSFHRNMLLEMSRVGFGKAWFITIDGSDAAFGFGYVAHNQFNYRFTAFRLKYSSSISVGKVLTSWIVRDACNEQLSSFDFGHGEAWYKQFWANECYSVYRMAAGRGVTGYLMSVSYYVVWLSRKTKWIRSLCHCIRKILYRFKTED